MGRRKKAVKKVVKRVRPTVAKVFKCLFCNHDKSVACSLDMKSMTGTLECAICHAKYQTSINKLTEPIDIFTEWLDEAAAIQAKAAKKYSAEMAQRLTDEPTESDDIANIAEYDEE
jgi:transcription elongation factor Elf1